MEQKCIFYPSQTVMRRFGNRVLPIAESVVDEMNLERLRKYTVFWANWTFWPDASGRLHEDGTPRVYIAMSCKDGYWRSPPTDQSLVTKRLTSTGHILGTGIMHPDGSIQLIPLGPLPDQWVVAACQLRRNGDIWDYRRSVVFHELGIFKGGDAGEDDEAGSIDFQPASLVGR